MYDPESPFTRKPAKLEPGQKNQFAEERLRSAVIWCELQPGETVAEAGLSERFGLGRAATRATLAKLASEGWVAPIARLGWQVLPMTGALIGHVLEARRLAEPAMAEVRLADAEEARLCELDGMIEAMSLRDEADALSARRQYLAEMDNLFLAGTNPLIQGFLRTLWAHSDRIVCFLEQNSPERFHRTDATALISAYRARDAEGVKAARLHLVDEFERFAVAQLLKNDGPLTGQSTTSRVEQYEKPRSDTRSTAISAEIPGENRRAILGDENVE